MQKSNQEIVLEYIRRIWNEQHYDALHNYLASEYRDHSLISSLPPDIKGVKKWIEATSASFKHRTRVEDLLCDGDKVFIRIRMELKHVGVWRDIAATGMELETDGYRLFRLHNGKIAEHWALIDGQVIENTLRAVDHSCTITPAAHMPDEAVKR